MQIESQPEEIDIIERKILQLEMEKLSLSRENDDNSKKRLGILENELNELKNKKDAMKLQWQNEKTIIDEIGKIKSEFENLKAREEEFIRAGNLAEASKVKYGEKIELEKKLNELSDKLKEIHKNKKYLREEITEEDIAAIVANWTGIPIQNMLQSEKEKLLKLEEHLHEMVIGQNEAINAVSDAIRRNKAGISDENHPIGTFIFAGPTGVGKTELAKSLAIFLFDDVKAMSRIDMSEYMEKHSVSRLIGAPPGYVGYDEGGQLTEIVRRRPYSVILFDEIEKAHQDIFNVLLQLLDEGRLTDGQGRTVDFRNTIIIMTSNLGSHIIQETANLEETKPEILKLINTFFRPEFINRVDDIILFHRLDKNNLAKIIDIQLRKLSNRLKNKDIIINYTKNLVNHLTELGYDPQFGARPLKRAIQTYIENELSKKIISGEIKEKDKITIDVKDNKIIFRT